MSTFEFYRGDPRYPADAPHYVTTTASNWRSEPYRSRADARDYNGAFATIDDAFDFLASVSTKDWWQIVDTFDQTIVRESQRA